MSIRTRLTLWYALIMFVSLSAMGVAAYFEFAQSRSEVLHAAHVPEDVIKRDEVEDFDEMSGILLWCGLPALLIAATGGWWFTRHALKPVTTLTEAAERIHDRNLGERLPRTGNRDELDRLTDVFNAMIARLDGSFQRIREFTLHASHELKTPITVLCGETETLLRDDSLPASQRDRAVSELEELRRLAVIVDGLTLLAKADAGQIQLTLAPVRLDDLVRDSFDDTQILAHASAIRVELTACDETTVLGDAHRLRQLLLNLADNAVKYNQHGGSITMSLRQNNGGAEFTIGNTGPGIPPEILPRVFDRFFRGDSSHSGDGCGLGLSIAQWIVAAHNGTIQIASTPAKLTTVTVRLPISSTTLPNTQSA